MGGKMYQMGGGEGVGRRSTIFVEELWETLLSYCRLLKPFVRLIRLVDSNMPSVGKVHSFLALHSQNDKVNHCCYSQCYVCVIVLLYKCIPYVPCSQSMSGRHYKDKTLRGRFLKSFGIGGISCRAHYIRHRMPWSESPRYRPRLLLQR